MILYAAMKGYPLALYTTLQGATMEDYEKLKWIQYEVVTIHLPDKDGRSHFNITDDYINVLRQWNCDNYSCHGQIDDREDHTLRTAISLRSCTTVQGTLKADRTKA